MKKNQTTYTENKLKHKSEIKKKDQNPSKNTKKAGKDITAAIRQKPVKKIVEFYYFIDTNATVRELQSAVPSDFSEKTDIWPELNLMEVEMTHDSLIFQDANECFIDPLDFAWFEEQHIQAKYQISYDIGDIDMVCQVMHPILSLVGGRIYSDTDDFEPSFGIQNLEMLKKI